MSINLLTTVQKNLGYPELKKVDPNTERPVNTSPNKDRLTQAIVPAVLAGIYELAKNDAGVEQIALETASSNWVEIIFGANKEKAVKNISDYTFYNSEAIEDKITEAAIESIRLIRENTKSGENFAGIKIFISNQRNNILPFLIPELHIGSMLDDTTIDDATTKMQGPVSSMMHKLESGFSSSETMEDADRKHF